MLGQLSDKLQGVFKTLRGHGKLSETNITEACRAIRIALLEADVHFQVARELIEKIKVRAMGAEVLESITPGQQFTKIFQDELATLLGEPAPLETGSPLVLLMCGLQGSGKTTTTAKLALWLKKQGRHPYLVPADLQRPAAVSQLETLAKQVDVPVHHQPGESNPVRVVEAALVAARNLHRNVILIDTAGRLDLDEALMAELVRIKEVARPQESLFVADAALGQKAVEIVSRFHAAVPLTGIILTRLDGDARGGAALSMRQVTGLPIKFLGTGEKPEQFELMDGNRLASRILGMGDIVGLVERAQEAFDLEDAAKFEEKMRRQDFNLEDFLSQMRQMRKLGPMENLLGMMPGMPKVTDSTAIEKRLRRTEAILLSMTLQERRKPEVLNAKRRQRVARGSGTTVTAVNDLLLQFNGMKKLMKSKGKMKQMMARLGGGMG